jgi:quinoprotein glucose dehydrogenase
VSRPATLATVLLLAAAVPGSATADDYHRYRSGNGSFAAQTQITPDNVATLQAAWHYRTGEVDADKPPAAWTWQARPLLVEDALVLCTPENRLVAIDAATGEERWRFDPQLDLGLPQPYQYNCRGAPGLWHDTAAPAGALCKHRFISQTLDHRLFAVDADSGRPCPDFGDNGQVKAFDGIPMPHPDQIRLVSTPLVVGDVVVLGSAITDNVYTRGPRGTVQGFDARTGRRVWTFDPIPNTAEQADPQDWDPALASSIGAANVWTLMAADSALGLVYLPTSSAAADHYAPERPGDNRHANSVVALHAATGAIAWSRQLVHHDLWDYDLPAQPMLIDYPLDGKPVPALLQNTKQGLVFILDRRDGTPLVAIEERPVPTDGLAGEQVAPTQPFPVGMPALAPLGMREDELWGLTFWDKRACRRRFRALRAGGVFEPPGRKGTIFRPPFVGGAVNWGGASFNPDSAVMIAPVISMPSIVTLRKHPPADAAEASYSFVDGPVPLPSLDSELQAVLEVFLSPLGAPCSKPPWHELVALDTVAKRILWRVPLGTTARHAPLGIAFKWGAPGPGGPLSTAGGVTFVGASLDGRARAFDSTDGRELWSQELPTGAHSFPVSYSVGDRQYVVFVAGGHAILGSEPGDHVVAYTLPR